MPTSAIAPIGAAASTGTPPTSASATSGPQLDRDTFLQLLVAQLKYQDPSKPTDASTFISQSAQLAVVDKLDAISTTMERAALSSRLDTAAAIVGQTVRYALPSGVETSGVVTAVRFDGNDTYVEVGGVTLPLQSVLAVLPPPTPVAPAVVTPPTTTAMSAVLTLSQSTNPF